MSAIPVSHSAAAPPGSAAAKTMVYVGGLAEEVDQKVLRAAFIPFGDIKTVELPLDFESRRDTHHAFLPIFSYLV